ncbi:hypothetical protein SVTN_32920 [Streptomyces vietnamensis]|uniref:Uncharacterized protein n=1 Tax=Streptomyces vietnamensis TaxID=362257 RepID=A0A0B5IJ57_9ACTN|nr:hypothetical protein SVTN_32920 [Streptomyces vietnamensis]
MVTLTGAVRAMSTVLPTAVRAMPGPPPAPLPPGPPLSPAGLGLLGLAALDLTALDLTALELAVDLRIDEAQTAHGPVDALLLRDRADGGVGEGLDHQPVAALLLAVLLALGPAHAGGDGVDDDDQLDAEREPGGDDERRLSAAAQLAPEVGEEHGREGRGRA